MVIFNGGNWRRGVNKLSRFGRVSYLWVRLVAQVCCWAPRGTPPGSTPAPAVNVRLGLNCVSAKRVALIYYDVNYRSQERFLRRCLRWEQFNVRKGWWEKMTRKFLNQPFLGKIGSNFWLFTNCGEMRVRRRRRRRRRGHGRYDFLRPWLLLYGNKLERLPQPFLKFCRQGYELAIRVESWKRLHSGRLCFANKY